MTARHLQLAFDGISRPIALEACAELVPVIASVTGSWRFAVSEGRPPSPAIGIKATRDGYQLRSDWLEEPVLDATPAGIVCAFIVDLVRAHIEDAGVLCLHCGAVEIGGTLAVFPSWYRAGKSTLCARLAAAGHRQFADDVLPVDPASGEVIAIGIAPRLRRPFPRGIGAAFRGFIEAHRGPGNRRYQYLSLPAARHAPFGASAPIGAIVLLERHDGPAAIAAVSRAEALKRLLAQNFGHPVGPDAVFARLAEVASRVPCLLLRYSDLDEAVGLLEGALADVGTATLPAVEPARFDGALPPPTRRRPVNGSFVRAFGVERRDLEGACFLLDRRGDAILHLNPLAAFVWEALSEPVEAGELSALLAEAHPAIEPARVDSDVRCLFADLLAHGLIERAGQGAQRARRLLTTPQ